MSSDYTYLVGRVGTPPVLKTTPSGKELVEFRLAVDGAYDTATRSRTTEWYDVTVWEPLHATVADAVGVGSRIYVGGSASVYKGASGDRNQIKAREVGLVDSLRPASLVAPPASMPDDTSSNAWAGITLDDEGEW